MIAFVLISLIMFGLIIAGSCYGYLVSTYKKYSQQQAQVDAPAIAIISASIDYYKFNTKITLTDGFLTDFYVPKRDVIALSHDVAYSKSVADISVACHEFGHCLQKHDNSGLLKFSIFLNFLNKLASFFLPIVAITCIIFVFMSDLAYLAPTLFYASLALWGLTWLSRLISIPVELDASKRAYNMLSQNKILTKQELKMTKKILNAAALTYVGGLFKNLYKFYWTIKKSFRRD